jgi:hypothetical protein
MITFLLAYINFKNDRILLMVLVAAVFIVKSLEADDYELEFQLMCLDRR